ncbi:MAG: amidohydrolase family protein [Myxococcota bacterium]|nr:amidohydrolase family protein [Myxococcota bacterium]
MKRGRLRSGQFGRILGLDALEHAGKVNGTSGLRHRIEQLEYADPEDIARVGALGITASMQPVHADPRYLVNWRSMLGEERAEQSFAWPLYLETGATLAFGTDSPTAPHEALPNMYVAATRKSPSDASVPAHRPEWALPLTDALLHGTRESARAAWLDHITGMFRPGFAADLVVLDGAPIAQGPEALLKTNVRLTMMDGRIIYLG